MFTKVLTRYSKKFLKKKADSYEDQAEFDADAPLPLAPVVDYSERIDRILEFYTDIKQNLLQKLEGLDFDPVLPESSRKVINSDQTVEGLKESDLSQFPTKYYGIVLFKKTLEELEHRITHLSKVKAGNVKKSKELVEAHEEVIGGLNVADLLVHFKLPSQVVNGYWFHDNLPQYGKSSLRETWTIIYIPPNAVDNLKELPIKGTFKCEADFKVDPDISFAIKLVKNTVEKIDGFVCLDEIVSTDATGFTVNPRILLTCTHGFSKLDSWRCSACLGNITGYKRDGSTNHHVHCQNCGFSCTSGNSNACFCKGDHELKKEVEELKNLVKKLESQIATPKMIDTVTSGSLQDVD